MGCWGMGIAQSDEFCEVYDSFMKEYNKGDNVFEISQNILADYHKDFDDHNGIMHDVYFALAKAEWMCCEQSTQILLRVREIIESNANIEFYQELGASDNELKIRKKKLSEFWEALQTPRAKPRKRSYDALDKVKELPPVKAGECYAYKYEDKYRVIVILDRFKMQGWNEQVLCCIFKNSFDKKNLLNIDYLSEKIAIVNAYIGLEFLSKTSIKKIGEIGIAPNMKNKMFGENELLLGKKKEFKEAFAKESNLILRDMI